MNCQLPSTYSAHPLPPRDNLARFRWHTGATPVPVPEDEPLTPLFRDIGPEAMVTFLRGGLNRLAGPVTPLTYLRTARYVEPYTDHARIGRLVLLRPKEVQPWRSGIDHIFISAAHRMPSPDSLGFIPGILPLAKAEAALADVRDNQELRETFGGRDYDELRTEHLARLDQLNRECRDSERWAAPCRRLFQTGSLRERQRLAERLASFGLTESDLCTAWHHLPVERRNLVNDALRGFHVTEITS